MKVSKFLSALCVLMLTVLFCGCSSVGYTAAQHPDGSITETLYVKPNATELGAMGVTVHQVLTKVRNDIAEYLTTNSVAMSANGATLTVVPEVITPADTEIRATLRFGGYFGYCAYYGIDADSPSTEYPSEVGIYTTKQIIYKGPTDFSGSFAQVFINSYTSFINDASTGTTLDASKVSLSFTQGTLNSRTRSDADTVSYKDGVYYHTWTLTLADILDADKSVITLYRVAVTRENRVWWYLTGVAATIVIMAGVAIVVVVRKRRGRG